MKNLLLVLCLNGMLTINSMGQPEQLANQAYELRMNGKTTEAIILLDSALFVYPEAAVLWFEKGRCYDWIKLEGCSKFIHTWTKLSPDLKKSHRCLVTATRLDPGNARFQSWASQSSSILFLKGIYTPWEWPTLPFRSRTMIRHARQAVLLDPQNPEYRYNLINLLKLGRLWGGDRKEARSEIEHLESLDPVYAALAKSELSSKKEPYELVPHLIELSSTYPNHLELNRALAFRLRANPEKSRQYLLKWLEIDPLSTEAIRQLYFQTPDESKSSILQHIEAYIARAEKSYAVYQATGYELLGRYYELMKDPSKARFYHQKSKELFPLSSTSSFNDWLPPMK